MVPWNGLLALIEPYYPKACGGRKPYPLDTMLRIHLLQNWFALSDPAVEEALYVITSLRQFARLTLSAPIPEDTTIMNIRHLLEKHQLAAGVLTLINDYLQEKGLSLRQGTIVDATFIHAPSSTKNGDSMTIWTPMPQTFTRRPRKSVSTQLKERVKTLKRRKVPPWRSSVISLSASVSLPRSQGKFNYRRLAAIAKINLRG